MIQTFNMLDIDCADNIDAGIQQFFNIFISFLVKLSGHIGMSNFFTYF